MTQIRFDNGSTITMQNGFVQASSPALIALLEALAATLPGYVSPLFEVDADFNNCPRYREEIGFGEIAPRTQNHMMLPSSLSSGASLQRGPCTPLLAGGVRGNGALRDVEPFG